jgi:hypothetical protein
MRGSLAVRLPRGCLNGQLAARSFEVPIADALHAAPLAPSAKAGERPLPEPCEHSTSKRSAPYTRQPEPPDPLERRERP